MRLLYSLILLLTAASCKPPSAAFTPPPIQVGLLELRPGEYPWSAEFRAEVRSGREAVLRPRVSGLIVKRSYREGEAVKAGQVLFEIDPRPYALKLQIAEARLAEAESVLLSAGARIAEAEARLQEVKVRRDEAGREARRQEQLLAAEASSRREVDAAKTQEALAEAMSATAESSLGATRAAQAAARNQVHSARSAVEQARLELSWCSVAAPIAGLSSLSRLEEGSLVSPESELCRISDNWEIHCGILVAESEFRALSEKLAAKTLIQKNPGKLHFQLFSAAGEMLVDEAEADVNDWQLDLKSQTRILRCVLRGNAGRISPGQLLRARIKDLSIPGILAVPRHCVFDGPMGKFVYVAAAGKDLAGKPGLISQPRPVQVGRWLAGARGEALWEIIAGVNAGEHIVDSGSAKLRPMPMAVITSAPAAAAGE
ncbi:MAG: Multidrug efflux pump subunit AcrA [Verrucomicrobiota bacterium]|jgi:membrane fusion protein (multidrug efflux system)